MFFLMRNCFPQLDNGGAYSIFKAGASANSGGRGPDKLLLSTRLQKCEALVYITNKG